MPKIDGIFADKLFTSDSKDSLSMFGEQRARPRPAESENRQSGRQQSENRAAILIAELAAKPNVRFLGDA